MILKFIVNCIIILLFLFVHSEDMVKEIRVLYDEMGNKYKSCRECYELCKAAHLSESFTFHRIVIQKAIKNNEIRLKHGVDICSFSMFLQQNLDGS